MTLAKPPIPRDSMFYRFSLYGFLKNLRFFDPFILLILRSYGLTFFQIGLLYSIRGIATNILEFPSGVFSDAFGRRRTMILAFISYIISFLGLYFMQDFGFLALAMILFGFGEACRTGTHKALILEYLKIKGIVDLKVAYYGLTRSASQFGSALNALIAAALVFYTGSYRIMFLAATLPYALDLLNIISYPKELDGTITKVQGKEVWIRIKDTLGGFSESIQDRSTFAALLNSASFIAAFKVVKDYLQPLLSSLALSLLIFTALESSQREALIIGLVYFVIYLLTSLASRRAYYISNRFSSLPRAVNGTYLIGVGILIASGIFISLEMELVAVLGFVAIFLINNIRRPINVGILSERISSRVMASGLSTESLLTTLLSSILAPLVGFLVDNLDLGWGVALLGLAMVPFFFLVRVRDLDHPAEDVI